MQSNILPYSPSFDVPAAAFKNWAGGFTDTLAAANFASSGGIPVTALISGGQVSQVRLEHIWVEAAIDFLPSRGAKNQDADSWVALDPSYKQYDYKKGLDAVAISGLDPEQLAQSFINSGTTNDSESWATGFDASILNNAQSEAQQKLAAYIQNHLTDATVGDVIGGRQTIIQDYPMLPSSLPNKLVVIGPRYDQLPGQLQQKITWAFGKDILGDLIDPVSFPFAKGNNRKITLSFKPATEADEQALQSLLPDGEITDLSQLPSTIPSYLVKGKRGRFPFYRTRLGLHHAKIKQNRCASIVIDAVRASPHPTSFVVGDADLATAARADTSLSALVDQFKVDTPLCLQPWTGKYPKR